MRKRAAHLGFAPRKKGLASCGVQMSFSIEDVINGNGSVLHSRGVSRRMNSTSLSYCGVELEIEYLTEGAFIAATDVDDVEIPICNIKVVKHQGEEITQLLSETQIGELEERIESAWRGE
jgi:hypothetical protein